MAWEPFGLGPKPRKLKGEKRPFAGKVRGFVPARPAIVVDGKVVLTDDESSVSSSMPKSTSTLPRHGA